MSVIARSSGSRWRTVVTSITVLGLSACSPALNWRETRLDGVDGVALFPCRPDRFERELHLTDSPRPVLMLTCEAAGSSFAVSVVTLDAADGATPWPERLVDGLKANLAATETARQADWRVPGLSQPGLQVALSGHAPDGRALQAQTLVLRGPRWAVQATILGPGANAGAAQTFFEGLRWVAPAP